MDKHITKSCSVCGQIIESELDLKCNTCGSTSRTTKLELLDSVGIDEEGVISYDQLVSEKVNEQVEKRKYLTYIVFIISYCSPLVGFFVADYIGVVAGIVFGAITYHFGPMAIFKIKQITKIYYRYTQRF